MSLHTITVMLVHLLQPPEQSVHVSALHSCQSLTPGSSDVRTVICDPPYLETLLPGDHVLTRLHLEGFIPAPYCGHLAPVENIRIAEYILGDVHVYTGHLKHIILVDKRNKMWSKSHDGPLKSDWQLATI